MKGTLDWIKGNPISVVSIVLIALGLGIAGYFFLQGRGLEDEVAAEAAGVAEIRRLQTARITIPAANVNDSEETIPNVTINAATVAEIGGLFEAMQVESAEAFRFVNQINAAGHLNNLLVPNLFDSEATSEERIHARRAYREAMASILTGSPANPALPALDAGLPPRDDRIDQALTETIDRYMEDNAIAGQGGTMELEPEAQQRLMLELRGRLMELLTERATSVDIYAQTDPAAEGFPLVIEPWAYESANPSMQQLWEGQMQVWITADVMRAIQQVNAEADQGVGGVMDAPVKRLIHFSVLPGYVGIDGESGVGGLSQPPPSPTPVSQGQVGGNNTGSFSTGGGFGGSPSYGPSDPAGGSAEQSTSGPDADQRQPERFDISPTGRASNAIFDVRHARLIVDVDYQRLPQLFEALAEVNFMTVVDLRVEDVDEYAMLREGFVYTAPDLDGRDGVDTAGDIVRVDMIIETLWLREWTSELMPEAVKQDLGIGQQQQLTAAPSSLNRSLDRPTRPGRPGPPRNPGR